MRLSQDIIDNMSVSKFDEYLLEDHTMIFVDLDIQKINEADTDILYRGRRDDMNIIDILESIYNV